MCFVAEREIDWHVHGIDGDCYSGLLSDKFLEGYVPFRRDLAAELCEDGG